MSRPDKLLARIRALQEGVDEAYRQRRSVWNGRMNSPRFRCPLCKSEFFDRVAVPRANGMLYDTPFYRCGGCSVMFLDPVRFMESRPRIRGDEFAPRSRTEEG